MTRNKDHIKNSKLPKPDESGLFETSDKPTEMNSKQSNSKKKEFQKNNPSNSQDDSLDEAIDSWNRFKAKYVGKTVFLSEES